MTLAELLRKVIDHRLAGVRVALPAKVEKYDKEKQTVDAKPLLKSRVEAEGGLLVESLPLVPTVPVVFPRGGGFFLSLPLKKGDTGLLIMCDWSLDQWQAKGGEVDPVDLRTHHLVGATFYPGLHDEKHPIDGAHGENLVLGKEGGAQVHLLSDLVALYEENAADFVALAQKCDNRMAAIENKLNSHIAWANAHTHILTLSAGTGTAAIPAPPDTTLTPGSSTAATKVKAT